jgi:hypothetical protein
VIHHIPQFIAVCRRSSPPLPPSPHDAEEEVAAQEQALERQVVAMAAEKKRPRKLADDFDCIAAVEKKWKPAFAAPTRTSPRRKVAVVASAPMAGRGACDQGDKLRGRLLLHLLGRRREPRLGGRLLRRSLTPHWRWGHRGLRRGTSTEHVVAVCAALVLLPLHVYFLLRLKWKS